jgi:catalase
MTTNQGVPVSDNQHSLKAGLRGPALLKDFVLREKITHFDHERIPERIVHAARQRRARLLRMLCAAHRDHARGAVPGEGKDHAGVRALLHRAGRARLEGHARDVRGFAVKFYTDEATGIWWATTCPCSSSRTR